LFAPPLSNLAAIKGLLQTSCAMSFCDLRAKLR
jgi:hypothetical protein